MSNVTSLPKPASRSFAPINPDNPGEASFPHKLPIELAMGLNSTKEICDAYGLTRDDLIAIYDIPQFRALLDWAKETKMEPNGIFRLQMVMMSDDIATTIYLAMTDKEGGIGMRLRAAELAAKLGGLEAPKQQPAAGDSEKFAINIQFMGNPASTSNELPAINVEPR